MNRTEAARELGVPPGAPSGLVEKAFRHAARRRHPDLGGDATQFRRAMEARSVLLRPPPPDPVARVVDLMIRYHPAVRLVEAVVRVVESRAVPRP